MLLAAGSIKGGETFGNITKYFKYARQLKYWKRIFCLGCQRIYSIFTDVGHSFVCTKPNVQYFTTVFLWDKADKKFLKKCHKWDAKNIGRFMLTSFIFDITAYAVMWHIFYLTK